MTLADARLTPLARAAAADFAAARADGAVDCVYRPLGAGAGTTITKGVLVSLQQTKAVRPNPPGVNPGMTHPSAVYLVQLQALGADETVSAPASGVGDLGGIVRLAMGDTITVPGTATINPHVAEVTLRVRGLPRLTEGSVWIGEAS